MIVVSLKYVVLIMRADNRGEGGIMALIAASRSRRSRVIRSRRVALLGSAFSARRCSTATRCSRRRSRSSSAIEGLEVGTSAFKPYVVPIAVVVLVALFAFEASGTAAVGKLFGPVMLTWFIALA